MQLLIYTPRGGGIFPQGGALRREEAPTHPQDSIPQYIFPYPTIFP